MDIGLTSRADEDEKIFAIGNTLHIEEHLSEVMESEPNRAKEVAGLLDDVRKNRQDLVKIWANGRENASWWCPSKHAIITEIHIRELLNNASRARKEDVNRLAYALKKAVDQRRSITKKFLSGSNGNGGCPRCEDDLGKGFVRGLSKALNMPSDTSTINTHTILKKPTKRGELEMDLKDLGVINGGQVAGKGFVWLSDYVDRKLAMSGNPMLKRPSFYANLLGGAALQLAALKFIRNERLKLGTVILGSHAVSKVVDYAREALAVPGGSRRSIRAASRPAQAIPYQRLVEVD